MLWMITHGIVFWTFFGRSTSPALTYPSHGARTREGVQSSSNSNHPNLFCGKRAPQLVISTTCRETDLGGGDYYLRNSGLPPSPTPSLVGIPKYKCLDCIHIIPLYPFSIFLFAFKQFSTLWMEEKTIHHTNCHVLWDTLYELFYLISSERYHFVIGGERVWEGFRLWRGREILI